jgi:hypothetical protein
MQPRSIAQVSPDTLSKKPFSWPALLRRRVVVDLDLAAQVF